MARFCGDWSDGSKSKPLPAQTPNLGSLSYMITAKCLAATRIHTKPRRPVSRKLEIKYFWGRTRLTHADSRDGHSASKAHRDGCRNILILAADAQLVQCIEKTPWRRTQTDQQAQGIECAPSKTEILLTVLCGRVAVHRKHTTT